MDTLTEVMAALQQAGSPRGIEAAVSHGAPAERVFGVSVNDLKAMAPQLLGRQELAYELFETGNGDAQYLAALIADGALMSRDRLDAWARGAAWSLVSEFSVPWVATESEHARALALRWKQDDLESVASCGWATYAGYVSVTPDDQLDLPEIERALDRIEQHIATAPNRVKATMNGFVIAVGTSIQPLSYRARETGRRIGKLDVRLGDRPCKVPLATKVILKAKNAGRVGQKRTTVKG